MPLAQGDHKICSSCRQEFPLSGFDQNRAQRDGLHNQCRTCAAAARKKSQLKDLPRWREYQKSWNRKARYGLTDEEFARAGGLKRTIVMRAVFNEEGGSVTDTPANSLVHPGDEGRPLVRADVRAAVRVQHEPA